MSSTTEIQGIRERIALLTNKLNKLKLANIRETDPSVLFKLEEQIKEIEQQLTNEKDQLAVLLSNSPISSDNQSLSKFASHHQYTCDRSPQDAAFLTYYYQESDTNKKLHFFYLHGGDLQEHKGLYKRFVHKLAGEDLDYKLNYQVSEITVKDFDAVYFPNYTEIDALKIGISRELMKSLAIEDYQMERVMEKNLAFALKESPELNSLTVNDKVCFFIAIPETRWDPILTPQITHWFITKFCKENLPKSAPDFHFFFAVEYDEDNLQIQSELANALKNAKFTLALPELEMVKKGDVQDWFTTYDIFWERKSQQKKTFKQHFENEDNEMYMEDVQDILKNIINEINNSEKDDPRNS